MSRSPLAQALELSLWDKFVFGVSVLLAVTAALVRVREGSNGAFKEFRWLHNAIGLLALFYGIGYAAVLVGLVDHLTWSRFSTGVSLFACLLVWIYPPVLARRLARSITEKLEG